MSSPSSSSAGPLVNGGLAAAVGAANAKDEVIPMKVTTPTSVAEIVNGTYDFKISGYSLLKGIGFGNYIKSNMFTVGGYEWAVYFYPDGKNEDDNATYVSLFIVLPNGAEGTGTKALFELTLLDQSGKGRHKIHSHFGKLSESEAYTLKYPGSMWGFKRFIKRSELEASDDYLYLKDDCLHIQCRVGVFVGST